MNDSARKSRAVPLMTTRGRPTALMSGRPAALPNTYTSPPLAPYMKVWPDIAVNDQLAALHDLTDLVLAVAVHDEGQAVDAGGEVVARAAVHVDADTLGVRPKAASGEALPAAAVEDEAPPAPAVGLAQQRGVAVLALGREALGVHDEHFFAPLRSRAVWPRVAQSMRR